MSYIKINQANYKYNIEALRKKAGGKDKLMVVLKDNAYGHDLKTMAQLSSSFGIKKAAVKNIQEAKEIHIFFEETLILADHPPQEKQNDNISYAVHSIEGLKKFPIGSSLHVSIDSGMHRNGIMYDEIEETIELIIRNKHNLKGFFTHFRSADELSCEQYWQEENYQRGVRKVKELVEKNNMKMPSFHSCNSAALLRREMPIVDDFARCGIATYGYSHLDEAFKKLELKPVMSLWAEKLSSRNLEKGDRVGYGGLYEAKTPHVVSTYDIGYGDGIFRYNGLGDLVFRDGKVLGRISMDSFSFNGDKQAVCIFDDATYLAKYFNTITYEIITKLSLGIKRVVT